MSVEGGTTRFGSPALPSLSEGVTGADDGWERVSSCPVTVVAGVWERGGREKVTGQTISWSPPPTTTAMVPLLYPHLPPSRSYQHDI